MNAELVVGQQHKCAAPGFRLIQGKCAGNFFGERQPSGFAQTNEHQAIMHAGGKLPDVRKIQACVIKKRPAFCAACQTIGSGCPLIFSNRTLSTSCPNSASWTTSASGRFSSSLIFMR